MSDEPATKKDLDIVANQVGVLTNEVTAIRSEVTAIRSDMLAMEARITGEVSKSMAHGIKAITELVASNVTMVDEKYSHIPAEVRQQREDFDEHCQDAQAHRKHQT